MSDWKPTSEFPVSLKSGMSGWYVWTIQLALNDIGAYGLVLDGSFGALTDRAARDTQRLLNVRVDGIVGPITQANLCATICAHVEKGVTPQGLLKGLCFGESSGIIPETTALYPEGSRDYGCMQENILGPTQAELVGAYSPHLAISSAASRLRSAYERFKRMQVEEQAWRLAVLSYNWESAAQAIAEGRTASWQYLERGTPFWRKLNDPAPWVEKASGGRLRTGLEWCHFYIESKSVYVHSWSA